MTARKWPTGLPLVDKLRSCMLQNVPHNQTSGGCSALPYDAAELIHDLYDALLGLEGALGYLDTHDSTVESAALNARTAALAKARGQ